MANQMLPYLYFLINFSVISAVTTDEGTHYTLYTDEPLNVISDKFISFTIDPALLLTGLDISTNSVKLAKHLKPAYLRFAGPSTQYIEYGGDEPTPDFPGHDPENIVITENMWRIINEWISDSGLSAIFAISDSGRINATINLNKWKPLFKVSDEMNIPLHWQLGYDCRNKTPQVYKDDLLALYEDLRLYPRQNGSWKLVGADVSQCFSAKDAKTAITDLVNVTSAIMWESNKTCIWDISEQDRELVDSSAVPFWLTIPKPSDPITFSGAITWARQLGEAAKTGYEVLFRSPRARELHADSPVFWVSVFFKKFMGSKVLDVKPTANSKEQMHVYSHCTNTNEIQTSIDARGAITVMIINNRTDEGTVSLKIPFVKKLRVIMQMSIINSDSENSTDTFVNGRQYTINDLDSESITFEPFFKRIRTTSHVNITLPAKSIGFFIIPHAEIPICLNLENDGNDNLLGTKEPEGDDLTNDEDGLQLLLQPRFSVNTNMNNSSKLNNLYKLAENEYETDERYHKAMKSSPSNTDLQSKMRNMLLTKHKMIQEQKQRDGNSKRVVQPLPRRLDLKQLLSSRNRDLEKKNALKKVLVDELTSDEVENVLLDRQKDKELEKYKLTSEELDDIFAVLIKKFKRNNKPKRAVHTNLFNLLTGDRDLEAENASLNKKYQELKARTADVYQAITPTSTTEKVDLKKRILSKLKSITTSTPKPAKDNPSNLKHVTENFESLEKELPFENDADARSKNLKQILEADFGKEFDEELQQLDDINCRSDWEKQLKLPKSYQNAVNTYDDSPELLYRSKRRSENLDDRKRLPRDLLKDKLEELLSRDDTILSKLLSKTPTDVLAETQNFLQSTLDKDEVLQEIRDKVQAKKDEIQQQHEEFLEKLEELKSKIRIARSVPPKPDRKRVTAKSTPLMLKNDGMKFNFNAKKQSLGLKRFKRAIAVDDSENEIESNENRIDKEYFNYNFPKTNRILKDFELPNTTAVYKGNSNTNSSEPTTRASKNSTMTLNEGQNTKSDSLGVSSTTTGPKKNKKKTTKSNVQTINVNIQPTILEQIVASFNNFIAELQKKFSYYFPM